MKAETVAKILVVEDNEDFALTVVHGLTMERHTVEHAATGGDAIAFLRHGDYDAIVLDWNLPDMTGIEILTGFRARGGSTPVLMLTGNAEIKDKELGLDTGADDYLTKPFEMRELAARVRALLRRKEVAPNPVLSVRNVVLDPTKHRVTRDGEEVKLPPRDFALLEFLMRHRDEVFSPEVLLTRVWHMDSNASTSGLRAAIVRIRKAVDTDDDLANSIIENVARVGYRLRG